MEQSVGKGLLFGLFVNLLCLCKGQDFCTAKTKGTEGTLRSDNYPLYGKEFSCTCRLTVPNSNPDAMISTEVNFEVENNQDPCAQRMVVTMGNFHFSICPRDEYKFHNFNIHLNAGEHIYIQALGTGGKQWMLKYRFTSTVELDIDCSLSNNTSSAPSCPCAYGVYGNHPEQGAASDDIGKKVGIGFGAVIGLLVLIAIIALILFIIRKRKRDREAEADTKETQEAPPLDQKQPQAQIHDPRYGAYPVYADVGDPQINTNLAYTPEDAEPYKKSSDSGLNSMHQSSQERLDQPPSYSQQYIPPQPNAAAPGGDPSVLYARPNKPKPGPESSRRSLTGMGAITGSNDVLYPYDNEVYMTDTSNSHNASKDYTQTEV